MTPVYVIRHAKAKSRRRWTEPDHLRPLTKAGLRQAAALPELFAGQPFTRLFSSPYVRCLQTLEPLAAERGLTLEMADALAEGAPMGEALELMLRLAGDGPAALCTHGDVMFDAVEELLAIGVRLEGPLEFAKGGTWVFEVTDRAFTGGRYLPPPP